MSYRESLDNMEFDKKETFFSNILWFFIIIVYGIVTAQIFKLINYFEDPALKLMALGFTIMFVYKVITFIGHPILIFRDKDKPYRKIKQRGY